MKLIKGFLCASAAVLAFTFCGCKKDSKSDSGGSDDYTGSESSAFSSKFSPKVHEDAEIALGLNLDQQKIAKVSENFFDQVIALTEEADDKKMIAERKEKFKEFVKDPFKDKSIFKKAIKGNEDFFEFVAAKLRKAKIGWAIVSAEEFEFGSNQAPEIALAVATDVKLEEIVAYSKQKAADGVRRNFVLEECTIADEKAWQIVPQNKRHMIKFKTMNIAPCFTSLDGELFLIASNRSALKKQIRLYRKGQDEGPLLRDFKPSHGDLVRLAAKNIGSIVSSVPSQKLESNVPMICPIDLLRQFKEIDLALTAKSGSAVALSLKLHTGSAENAEGLRATAKMAMADFCSRLPKTQADTIKGIKIAGTGDVFEVEINDVLPVLAIIAAPSSSTNPNGKRMSAEAEAARCANNLKALAMAVISCAQADDVYGHFPAAGYYRTLEINLGRSKGSRRQYCPHRSWISPKGNVYDLNHTLQTVYMGDPAHFSDSEDDWRLAVTNGAIWHAMGEVFEAYRCPIHTREFEKKNKRPPGWSYMMNQEFGYDRNEGKWSHFHGASIHGKITVATEASGKRDDGSASRDHDKVLMFAEVQAIDIQDEEYGYIQAVSDHSSTESDAVLEYTKESIGFNHRTPDGRYFGHVVFADGHVERIFCPKKGSPVDRFALTRALCQGADITYNSKSGSYMMGNELNMEERLRIEAEKKARFAAEMEALRQRKQVEEEEKRRKAEEKRRLAEEQKKANTQRKANIKRYADAMQLFRGTTLDLFSVAPKGDRPDTVKVETWFSCVVPSGRREPTLYEIKALPGKDIHVTRLDEEGNAADISFDELNDLLKKTSFLLTKGTHCYYRPLNPSRWSVSVPAGNQRVDPAKEDLGSLYEIVKNCDQNAVHLSYEVTFEDAGGGQTRLPDVPFGGQVAQVDVARGLEEANSARGLNTRDGNQKRLSDGKLIFRRKGRSW